MLVKSVKLDLFGEPHGDMRGKNATHSGGRGEPFHDWFPYLEGFSSSFVRSVRQRYIPRSSHIIEPFAGIGTTPIFLAQEGVRCSYCEVNPVLLHLIEAKIFALSASNKSRLNIAERLETVSKTLKKICIDRSDDPIGITYSATFGKSIYFKNDNYLKILALKNFERKLAKSEPKVASLFSVAVYSCLLDSSLLKRAGDVRFKTQKELEAGIPPIETLVARKLQTICSDLRTLNETIVAPKLIEANAKHLLKKTPLRADGVITSPPYLNGTNYLRNTRLELWYQGHLTNQTSLRGFRDDAVTSGINDVTIHKPFEMLPEVEATYNKVFKNAYDQRIPQMVASYFYEMKTVLLGLKKHVRTGGIICIDIGDSIYGGVHVPTHDVLIQIGASIGLAVIERVTLRERLSHNKEKLSQELLVFKK